MTSAVAKLIVPSRGNYSQSPREINHPVFGPSLAAIHGAMALPVCRMFGDPRPGELRKNLLPSLIFPLAVKIDGVTFKSSAPDQEAAGRRSVRPRMFPLGGLRIEGAKTKALDDRSLIGAFEKFQGNAAIQDLVCRQGSGPLAPGSIGQREVADGVPLAFEKIKLLCLHVRWFKNHIAHTDLPKLVHLNLVGSQARGPRFALPLSSHRFKMPARGTNLESYLVRPVEPRCFSR